MTCLRCGDEVADMRGHVCRPVWRSCTLCGQRYRVSRETARMLAGLEVSECPNCSPSLHGRTG